VSARFQPNTPKPPIELSSAIDFRVANDQAHGWHTFRHTSGTILNAKRREPESHSGIAASRQPQVTIDKYVQAVSDEKRKAQSKVVEMILPGIRKNPVLFNGRFWWLVTEDLASRTGIDPCRRCEREAIYRNSKETCGMDSTVR
jgi:hypothetical protein